MFSILLPHYCVICHKRSFRNIDLCHKCEKKLPFLGNACSICANPLPENTSLCGRCLKHKKPFDKTIALFKYEPPITQMITRLKFASQLHYAKLLGQLFAQKIIQKPDLIIPVPLHNNRLKERGFNQSFEIAKEIGKQWHIPVDTDSCKRIIHTSPQTQIPAKERKKNVANAFEISKKISAKHVAILDDVVTTGHTIATFCKLLRKQNIQIIDVWCMAKTILNK